MTVYRDLFEDLVRVRGELRGAMEKDGGASEDDAWHAYAAMERIAAILKLRMGVERPGVLMKVPRSKTPGELLVTALKAADEAVELFESEDITGALESVRDSRTALRGYLAEFQRARAREKRKSRTLRQA